MSRGRGLYTHDRDHSGYQTTTNVDPKVVREILGDDTDKIFGALGASAATDKLFTAEEVFGSARTAAPADVKFIAQQTSTRWAPFVAKHGPAVPASTSNKPQPALPTPPAGAAKAITALGVNKPKPALPPTPAQKAAATAAPAAPKATI